MLNKKKGLAMLLAATMIMGSAFPVMASEVSNSGNTTGTGTSEGHVEKKRTSVLLPVENTDYNASTFNYTMDPERLIEETKGGKYGSDYNFPTDNDTGVYFLTSDKKYENSSKALEVANHSSHSIILTVKAEVINTVATDIPLVAKADLDDASNASLYLGLVVGSEDAVAITSTTAAEKTVTLNGTPTNFKVDAKNDQSGYEYRELTVDEYKALDTENASATTLPWASTTFKLEGAATKGIETTATAPSVKVTWSWTEPKTAPANVAPSITTTTYTAAANTALNIPVNLGSGNLSATGITSVTYKNKSGANVAVASDGYTFANSQVTLTTATIDAFMNATSTTREYTITFNDDAATPITITVSK